MVGAAAPCLLPASRGGGRAIPRGKCCPHLYLAKDDRPDVRPHAPNGATLRSMEKAGDRVWEVFRQESEGDPMVHGGNVRAPDEELALH